MPDDSRMVSRNMILERAANRVLPSRLVKVLYRLRYGDRLMGMTSLEEQRHYEECAIALSDVEGAIVDLGCWMCSTTIALARGVRKAQAVGNCAKDKIFAFDIFVWEEWMNKYLPLVAGDYSPGDDFLPEARDRIAAYSDIVELARENLATYFWRGGPIKLLLVDAMKSWDLAGAIVRSFYGSLSEGSFVIHQDFKHYYTPWVHIIQYRLRDHFSPAFEVSNGGTVTFETTREISAGAAASAVEFEDVSDEEIDMAMRYSTSLVGKKGRSDIAGAHVMYFVHMNRPQKAREILDSYLAQGMRVSRDLALARRETVKAGGATRK